MVSAAGSSTTSAHTYQAIRSHILEQYYICVLRILCMYEIYYKSTKLLYICFRPLWFKKYTHSISCTIVFVLFQHCLPFNMNYTKEKKTSRAWFRSTDLWVMGPARFHCATLLRKETSFRLQAYLSSHLFSPLR